MPDGVRSRAGLTEAEATVLFTNSVAWAENSLVSSALTDTEGRRAPDGIESSEFENLRDIHSDQTLEPPTI